MDTNLIGFIILCLVLAITPGVDMALVTKNVIAHSKKGGIITMLGICSGLLIYALLTASGLSYLLVTNYTLYMGIKYLGVIYLLYLGGSTIYRVFKKDKDPLEIDDITKQVLSHRKLYLEGLITNLLNPKIIIFYLSVIPQFIDVNSASFGAIFTYALINITIGIAWLYCYIMIIDKAHHILMSAKIKRREGLSLPLALASGEDLVEFF